MLNRNVVAFLSVAILCWLGADWNTVSAQKVKDPNARGRQLYYQYCASCHGIDGKGTGPVAASLKGTVPNLHTIAREDGKFPTLRVRNIIAGELNTPAHGTREMPVWGRVLRGSRGSSAAQLDIYALAKYLEAVQGK